MEPWSILVLSVRHHIMLVREPVIGLIKWLRPKGLKVSSYVEKFAEFKNKLLKKSADTQKCYPHPNFVYMSIKDSGEFAHMHRLAWTAVASQCDKYKYLIR